MLNWLYFIQSNREYHGLMDFLVRKKEVSGISYLVFDDDVYCNDGRVFLRSDSLLIAVNFFTQVLNPRKSLTDFGLNPASLISFYDIVCEDEDPYMRSIKISERAKRIIWDKDLVEFLSSINFKFKDDSKLTIPEASLEYNL